MAGAEFKKGYNKGFAAGADSVEEGLPGWFGTFADMMTLLFAFFVLLTFFFKKNYKISLLSNHWIKLLKQVKVKI